MYHPGKVLEVITNDGKEVISSDSSTQATLRMWDENILTLAVGEKIAPKIKAGQTVLVDYRPDKSYETPVPLHIIVTILTGKKALKVWDAYREMFDKRKVKNVPVQSPAQSYIG
jgi:hypothetical protein